jgi:predicted ATP-dependent protease
MIPAANVLDLHLDPEVIRAVEEGSFSVWEVSTVEQGIELLTGVPAGTWDEGSGWSDDGIYGRCQHRLEEMVRLLRLAGKPDEKVADENQEETDDGGDEDHTDH